VITNTTLCVLPDDRPTQLLWRDVALSVQIPIPDHRLLKVRKDAKDIKEKQGVRGRKGRYQIQLGPSCTEYRVVKVFLIQSLLHRAISRQRATVTDEMIEKFWPRTLDAAHTWCGVFEMMFGPVDMRYYSQALVSAYSVCVALQDPFSLQRGLEKLAGELLVRRYDPTGVRELIDRSRVYLWRYHEFKGFFRDAGELALDNRAAML
jgi:hypothetical protein